MHSSVSSAGPASAAGPARREGRQEALNAPPAGRPACCAPHAGRSATPRRGVPQKQPPRARRRGDAGSDRGTKKPTSGQSEGRGGARTGRGSRLARRQTTGTAGGPDGNARGPLDNSGGDGSSAEGKGTDEGACRPRPTRATDEHRLWLHVKKLGNNMASRVAATRREPAPARPFEKSPREASPRPWGRPHGSGKPRCLPGRRRRSPGPAPGASPGSTPPPPTLPGSP